MKPTWIRNGTTGFALVMAVAGWQTTPVVAQCGESKPAAPATSSCCGGTSTAAPATSSCCGGNAATTPTAAAVAPTNATELARYWSALTPDAARWYQHVQTLASPAFEGREPGTRGIERAADYIEFHCRELGLEAPFPSLEEPNRAGAARSFRQTVSLEVGIGAEQGLQGSLSIQGESLAAGRDFVMTSNAGEGSASGPIAFVGYGLDEGLNGYSNFDAKTNLSGKIALLFRLEPLKEDGSFLWGDGPSQRSSMIEKIRVVASHGAAGILIVNPPGAKHSLPELDSLATAANCCTGIPYLPTAMITAETAERLLRLAEPKSRGLLDLRRLADTGQLRSLDLNPGVTIKLTANVKPRTIPTDNLAGALRGKGTLKDEWLVIGGHYDHVGRGTAARADATDQGVLLGADDNASGTAAVLVLAKRFGEAYANAAQNADLRSILFVTFTAEERGLVGSRHFVQYAPMSLGKIRAMLNLDAVGRMSDDKLWLYGYATAKEFPDVVGPILAESGLNIVTEAGSHSSDQVSFQEAEIPVLFATTGPHADYHTSRDVADAVNPRGAARVLDLAEKVAMRLAAIPGTLTYQEQATTGASCCASSKPACGGTPGTPASSCGGQSPPVDGAAKSKCCG